MPRNCDANEERQIETGIQNRRNPARAVYLAHELPGALHRAGNIRILIQPPIALVFRRGQWGWEMHRCEQNQGAPLMKNTKSARKIVGLCVLALSLSLLSGCGEEGAGEKAGKDIDKAAKEASDSLKKAGEKAKDAMK
jgi:hypothetical protein